MAERWAVRTVRRFCLEPENSSRARIYRMMTLLAASGPIIGSCRAGRPSWNNHAPVNWRPSKVARLAAVLVRPIAEQRSLIYSSSITSNSGYRCSLYSRSLDNLGFQIISTNPKADNRLAIVDDPNPKLLLMESSTAA
jgi:hypothetical protein